MELRFARSESTFEYFEATRSYLTRHGKPHAFYSDKAAIFRVNAKNPKAGDGFTQFGRAMHDLNIDVICANTPDAKGRVERAYQVLQDRLVKELRLRAELRRPVAVRLQVGRGDAVRFPASALGLVRRLPLPGVDFESGTIDLGAQNRGAEERAQTVGSNLRDLAIGILFASK